MSEERGEGTGECWALLLPGACCTLGVVVTLPRRDAQLGAALPLEE